MHLRFPFLLVASIILSVGQILGAVPAMRPEYFEPPANRPADVCQEQAAAAGVRAIFYDGPQFRGKPTRVFAFYGAPKNAGPQNRVPGIVLVHGGGGTAFESWVKLWVDRGYAALAMDTCGCIPLGTNPKGGRFSNRWQRLPDGGPAGWGGFDQMNEAPEDHWMHQATAAVILGHSWLRAQPEVDPERTGVTGISWGGVLTSRVAGLDSRFKFAVPVYGCGFLDENSTWLPTLKKIGEPGRAWGERYDPGRVLANARMPILWLNGTNDFAFPVNSWRKSARTTPGTSRLCMPLRMPHGHGGAGENPKEIQIFADSIVRDGEPLLKLSEPVVQNGSAEVKWEGAPEVAKAELIFTRSTEGSYKEWEWEAQPASFDAKSRSATVTLPSEARLWFFHITDERGAAVSTEYREVQ